MPQSNTIVITPEMAAKTPIELIYDKIKDVIGGNNPNQFLCMTVPGTVLSKDTYAYDLTSRDGKPSLVLDEESLLANQLFDISQISAGNNGRLLSEQYIMALSNFIPPIDSELEHGRTMLRKMLGRPIKQNLCDGTPYDGTLQGLYEIVVEKWVDAKRKWFEDQQIKRDEINSKYSGDEAKERYNLWYEAVAESRLLEIEARYHAVVSIFSPDEFGEIMSVLSCGNKGRFEELKELALSIRKLNIDGGFTYPVEFEPADWFWDLESNLGYVDLLESPEHISMQIEQKQELMDMQLLELEAMQATVTTDETLKTSYKAITNAKNEFDKAQLDLTSIYTDNTIKIAKIAMEVYAAAASGGATVAATGAVDALKAVAKSKQKDIDAETADTKITKTKWSAIASDEGLKTLADMQKTMNQAQQNLLNAASKETEASLKYIEDKAHFIDLKPYFKKIEILSREIKSLQNKLSVSANTDPKIIEKLTSDEVSNRFMQVTTAYTYDQMDNKSCLTSNASQSHYNVGFFFGSASGSSSTSTSSFESNMKSNKTEINIGFLVTKVNIIRPWFNPGVFVLSENMKRISKSCVSCGLPPLTTDLTTKKERIKWPNELTKAELEKYNDAILPVYPVAFVIAKDVTIKIKNSKASSDEINQALSSHAASGGGFFCFSVSNAQSSNRDSKSFSSKIEGDSVTIRIPGPQIIGWYIEYTPMDGSDLYNPEYLTKQYEAAFEDLLETAEKK